MRRHAIGILALVLLAASALLEFRGQLSPVELDLQGACSRFGLILIFLWLAYDQLKRVPAWLVFVPLAVAVAFLFRKPQLLFVLIPVALLLAILKPRAKSRAAPRR